MHMQRRPLPCLVMLVLAHALASCGGGGSNVAQPPPPPEPGFTVGIQAPSIPLEIQGISQGQSVSIQAVSGFSGTVSLSLQNLPAGVSTAPVFPLQLSPGQSQYFSLMASSSASVG